MCRLKQKSHIIRKTITHQNLIHKLTIQTFKNAIWAPSKGKALKMAGNPPNIFCVVFINKSKRQWAFSVPIMTAVFLAISFLSFALFGFCLLTIPPFFSKIFSSSFSSPVLTFLFEFSQIVSNSTSFVFLNILGFFKAF